MRVKASSISPFAAAALTKTIRNKAREAARLLDKWLGQARGGDVEAVHQARVQSRRLRAALRLGEVLWGKDVVGAIRHAVREVARLLGPLRDLDVLCAMLTTPASRQNRRDARCEEWLLGMLAARREALIAELEDKLRPTVQQPFSTRIAPLAAQPKANDSELRDALRSRCRRQARRVARWAKQAHKTESMEALHALRIACKQLRYTAELLDQVQPAAWTKTARRCAAWQERLGALHDLYNLWLLTQSTQSELRAGTLQLDYAPGRARGTNQDMEDLLDRFARRLHTTLEHKKSRLLESVREHLTRRRIRRWVEKPLALWQET